MPIQRRSTKKRISVPLRTEREQRDVRRYAKQTQRSLADAMRHAALAHIRAELHKQP